MTKQENKNLKPSLNSGRLLNLEKRIKMDLENLNFKAKDMISFVIYIVTLTIFFVSMSNKVDSVTAAVEDLKVEKREARGEQKESTFITQNDIKALTIRAELNRQNIEIMQSDIEILKAQYAK